uniref:Pkinase_Tyr domain-containing protein n=1 Tax=Schistocephalus solidus TaxID=70667 RepID=A0A183SXT6_SCHSO
LTLDFSDIDLDEVITKVSTGYRLPNPSKLGFTCEKAAYNLMLDCWSDEPEARPSFRDVCFLLKDMFSEDEDIYASLD